MDGIYMISGSVQWDVKNNAQGVRVISIGKNDSGAFAYDARSTDTFEANVEVLSQTVSTAAVLEAGDYVELGAGAAIHRRRGRGVDTEEPPRGLEPLEQIVQILSLGACLRNRCR